MNLFKNELKVIIPLFLAFLIIYLLTANQCLTIVLDSACYIADIARGDYVFNPHHLFYHAAYYHWNSILKTLGFENVVANLDAFNSFFGSLSVVVIYLILRIRFNIDFKKALFYTAIPAFSFGFWIVSTSANVYAVSLFCQLLVFYLYLENEETWRKWLSIGLLNGIAITFNQWSIFVFIVITLDLIISERRKLLFKRYYWAYALSSGLFSLASYLLVLLFKFKLYTFQSMLNWMTYYSSEFEWTTSLSKAIREAIIGIGQTIVAPYWLFSFPGFYNLVKGNLASNVSFMEEAFFAGTISPYVSVILTVLSVFMVLILLFLSIKSIVKIKQTVSQNKKATIYLLTWIIVSSIMPFFWSGYNQRYWFIQTTAFYLFIILSNTSLNGFNGKNVFGKLLNAFAVLIFIINFFGVFLYSGDKSRDYAYHGFNEIAKKSQPSDLLVFRNNWTMPYYNDIYHGKFKTLNLHMYELRNKERLAKTIVHLKETDNYSKQHNIFIIADVFKNPENYPLEARSIIVDLKEKYKAKMKYHDTKFIDYYIIPKGK